jgi:hypothetical protein
VGLRNFKLLIITDINQSSKDISSKEQDTSIKKRGWQQGKLKVAILFYIVSTREFNVRTRNDKITDRGYNVRTRDNKIFSRPMVIKFYRLCKLLINEVIAVF